MRLVPIECGLINGRISDQETLRQRVRQVHGKTLSISSKIET